MNRTSTRLWDFPSAAFLILALLTVGQRLFSTHWAWGLGTAILLSLSGVLLGLGLGLSTFKQRTVTWFTFGYSLPIVLLVLGSILYRGTAWLERLADLSQRLTYSLQLLITKQPVEDTLLFVVFMALVFWTTGLLAGYALTRFANIVGAVVPTGVVLIIVQLYDPARGNNDVFLVIYFILCLLLLGRMTYIQRRTIWKEQHVALLAESRTDLNVMLVMVAIMSVFVVWLAPTSLKSFSDAKTAWDNFTRPLRNVQKDLGQAVVGLKASRNVVTVEFYGDTLPLGHQAAAGESVYFQVQVPLVTSSTRYYWRVRSYNVFLNDQWYEENFTNMPVTPDQALLSLADPQGVTSKFTITALSTNLGTLVTPARPVWVSSPAELLYMKVPQEKVEPVQFRSNPPLPAGEKYVVRANVYDPTILQLRGAGMDYPDWVTKNYLQLPAKLPPEIVDLAKQITADSKTPYDMAAAITDYLRSNITYSKTVETLPAGQDPLAWFLFVSKSGFCNYSATAEVIMLRAVGIPARMVVGFAQGQFDSPDFYLVRERDAHAWPEVYFPQAGWVEFEPTGNQSALERPLGQNPSTIQQSGAGNPGGADHNAANTSGQNGKKALGSGLETAGLLFLGVLIRLGLVWAASVVMVHMAVMGRLENNLVVVLTGTQRSLPALLVQLYEKRSQAAPAWLLRWASLVGLNPIERTFMTVYRSLRWLGEKSKPAQTPAEAAEKLARYLPDNSTEIGILLNEYQRHLYSPKHGYLPLARRAMKTIRQATLRVAIRQRWSRLRGIFRFGPE
jgi:transglutaminase-like putative cysteine protease